MRTVVQGGNLTPRGRSATGPKYYGAFSKERKKTKKEIRGSYMDQKSEITNDSYTLFFYKHCNFLAEAHLLLRYHEKEGSNSLNCCLVIYSGQNQKIIFASNLILIKKERVSLCTHIK